MSEKEPKVKREKKKMDKDVKINLTRCITAVICVALICLTCSSSVSKYCDKLDKITVAPANGDAVSSDTYDDSSNEGSDDVNVPEDTDTSEDDSSEDVEGTDEEEVSDEASSSSSGTSKTTKASSTTKKANSVSTKEEIISLFNKAANNAKSNSKSIKQNYCKNSQASGIELKNKTLASVADKLISANMGNDKEKDNRTYTTAADKNKYFPVENQSWASKLTAADVKSATVKENGGKYEVVIKLIDDTTPNLTAGQGHSGKAFSIVLKSDIMDNAGPAKSMIKDESVKITISNCIIKATIDKNTGNLLHANYYQHWRLALTALGIDVAVTFGIEEDYVINW